MTVAGKINAVTITLATLAGVLLAGLRIHDAYTFARERLVEKAITRQIVFLHSLFGRRHQRRQS